MNRSPQTCRQCGRTIYFDGICHQCQVEMERSRILALPQSDVDKAVHKMCREIEETAALGEDSEQLFTRLLNYRDINTEELAKAAFKNKLFWPSTLYKDAPDDIVEEMLCTLMRDDLDPGTAQNLLLCLAVHGGDRVYQVFWELECSPRKWREELYVDPSTYATYGGWSYDSQGNFLHTNFEKCYPMVKGTSEEKAQSPVKIGVPTKEKCPRCGGRLINLMELDGQDPRLAFLGIDGVIRAKCCVNCMGWDDDYFCKYEVNGESKLILDAAEPQQDEMEEEDELWIDELAANNLILGKNPVPLRYAADWDGGCSVGGYGFWMQDCNIRHCPHCGKPMRYLAQIQWDTVSEGGYEGNSYLEICKDCQIIAMLYQQT